MSNNMSQQPSHPKSPEDAILAWIYIRVKRNKTTYFIQCLPTEKTSQIKEKLQVLIDQSVDRQRLILLETGEILDDNKSLADQKVENEAVVALTLRKDDNEFEDINIVSPYDCNEIS